MIRIRIRIRTAKRFHHLQSLSSTLNKPSLLLSSPNCYNYLTISGRISRSYSSSSALLSPGAKKAKSIKELPLVEFCINTRLAYPNNDNGNNNDDDDDDDLLEIYDGNEFSIFPPTNNNLTTATTKQNYNTSDNSSRRGGYAIIGKNGCGKTLFAKSLIAEAAEASEAEADGSDNGNNDSNTNPYVRSGQITINNIDSGNSDNKSNNKYRHLRPNHPLRLKEEAKTKTTSSSSTSKIKIAHVSFDSHRQLLEERNDDSNNNSNNNSSITAFKAIAKVGNAPGKLNKAAQFLVIRFGLYPLLHRQVNTLSTGEIRKVLLVRALSIKPNILLLDNAFDGLDISSRTILCDIVSKTIKGFTNDILVQGIDSKDTNENTQVIIVTHRHEELNTIQEIDTIIYWENKNKSRKDKNKDKDKQNTWNVVRRRRRPQRICGDSGNDDGDINRDNKDDDDHNDDDDDDDDIDNDHTTDIDTSSSDLRYWSSGKEILYRAMGIELQSLLLENNNNNDNSNSNNNWNDSSLPTKDCVRDWWKYNENQENQDQNKTDTTDGNNDKNDILVEANNLTVRATRVEEEGSDDDTTIVLLHDLTWTVRKNERWIVGGGNGAGKSTLSRLLALQNQNDDHNHDHNHDDTDDTDDDESEINNNKSSLKILPNYNSNDNNPRNTIGWVSTETHMQQQQQQEEISIITTKEFLLKESKGASFDNVIVPILFWLGIIDDTPVSASKISLLERPFHCLSQGEQKLFMIVAALALRPPLLVLDEPCQGLDIVHRRRLLQVIERICQSTDMALIYITHHLKEELVPSITHAIHLKDRRAVYCGPIVEYNPEEYYDE